MVGTLLKIGNGRMPVSQVKTVLESRDRNLAGPTAAGNGLYLKEIRYEWWIDFSDFGEWYFSGGGLHADLATFTTNKQHGFVALTCLTAMTENGFEVIPVDTNVFKQQLDSLKDIPFSAIKIGLLPNVEIAELTLDFVKNILIFQLSWIPF